MLQAPSKTPSKEGSGAERQPAVVVLYGLADKPRRHGDLARLIGGISSKVLTHTLRRLESSGLVARHVYAEAPPRVDYELTELGRTLIDPIRMLAQWAEANGDAILDAQDRAGWPTAGHP